MAVQDSVVVMGEPPKVTLAGEGHVKPAGEDADTVKLTVPVKPFTAVTVIVSGVAEPVSPLTVTGDEGAIEKSVTWKSMSAVVCERVPINPVTVTV